MVEPTLHRQARWYLLYSLKIWITICHSTTTLGGLVKRMVDMVQHQQDYYGPHLFSIRLQTSMRRMYGLLSPAL